ncbi:MAG: ATP-binding protein [Kamptonema sp. SIO4C4]|nr:ATP-binding protein [Kamptonema sp. SIO4C4]
MPRSLKVHPSWKPEIVEALTRNGFLTQGALAGHVEMGLSTVNNFINSRPVYLSNFEILCDALGLTPVELINPPSEATKTQLSSSTLLDAMETQPSAPIPFYSYDEAWVGREEAVETLSEALRQSKRLVLILGLTGIGKTALAERLVLECQGEMEQVQRVNFEGVPSVDFAAIALQWLEEWGVTLTAQDREPQRLLQQVLGYLQEHSVLLLLDSLETLLIADETEEGGQFADEYWLAFFQGVLAASRSSSRLLITSQELPELLVQQRYQGVWESYLLTGLSEAEQRDLWVATGLDCEEQTPEFKILSRLGTVYQGHPLVLRVIVGEIWESFQGKVLAYWEEVEGKITEVETTLARAEQNAREALGAEDRWRLHKLTRKVRLEVNKQRLKATFQRLEQQVPDAYWLLCAAAVYRIPVQVEGWLMQLGNLVQAVEKRACSLERQERALVELSQRFLLEESVNHNDKRMLGQHRLIRSLALEHYQGLMVQLQKPSLSRLDEADVLYGIQ